MKRHYPEQPVVGVGAVVFRGEEVLLVQRGQEPAKGSWTLPGGAVEVGETLVGALRRELSEETGLTVEILGIAAVLERLFQDKAGGVAYHYVLIDFLCRYADGELTARSDITAARFAPLEGLGAYQLVDQTTEVIQRAWQQLQSGAFLPLL